VTYPAAGAADDANLFLFRIDQATRKASVTKTFDLAGVKTGATALAVSNGNVYVAGHFAGAITLDPACPLDSGMAGTANAFLAHFDTTGACKATQRFNNSPSDEVAGIAIEDANVVIAGTVNYGNGLFIHRYDQALGADTNSFFTAGNGTGSIAPHAVATRGEHLLIAGDFDGTFNVSFPSANHALDNGTDKTPDAFMIAYDISRLGEQVPAPGPYRWSEDYGSPGVQSLGAIAAGSIGSADAFFAVGAFAGTVDFHVDKQSPQKSSGGKDAIVAAVLTETNKAAWSKNFGDEDDQSATAIAYDAPKKAVLVGGSFRGQMKLGGAPLANFDGADHIFLARLDEGGNPVWRRKFGVGGTQSVTALIANNGEVILAGSYTGTLDFGCAPLVNMTARSRIFVARLTPTVR